VELTYPTLPNEGANAVSSFVSATEGSANFGGVVGPLKAVGLSAAMWNDPAAADTWAADWAVLLPAPAPLGLITSGLTGSNSFTYTVPVPAAAPTSTPAAQPVTVDLSATSGSATLVYQVAR
jgi:hypothetical protein